MNKTRQPIANAALLLVLALTFGANSWELRAAGQMTERARQDMALVYDSLDSILKDLQTYDFASGVGALMRLHAYVLTHKENPQDRKEAEAGLIKFVQGSPAPGGLMAACRALRLIGGPDSVPVLAALVLKPEATDSARYALERIPGGEADQALLAALDKTQGDIRRGVVFSLGERRLAAAAPALVRLAGGKDTVLAVDAIRALGKTGGLDSIQGLTAALGKSSAPLKSEIASALLLSAEGAMAAGDKAAAAGVYDKVFAANVSPTSRQAAFKGKLVTGTDPQGAILKTLAGRDPLLFAPALALVPANFGAADISRVADLMSGLPEDAQIQLTALLAAYPPEIVRTCLLSAAESPSVKVRLAALRSITAAGDGKSVAFLATKAARASGVEQEAARDALARLKGLGVDEAVLEHLTKTSDDAVKAELVQAASTRHIDGAKTVLIALVKSGSPALEARAAAALRTIAGQADIPGLLDLLGGLGDETARESMEDTVAAVARTNPRELARASEVTARLAGENDMKKRGDLLRVLGKIGDDSALSLVRTALGDPDATVVDAAVRALADWPTAAARDDVLEIARTSPVLNHRVLAMRAYVRMIGLEPFRAPEGASADLLKVLSLSPRPEEQKLVLGMLGRFPCITSLKTAESLLTDPAVAAEAKVAADRIRRALK
jgi:HEAT repeat protein